MARMVLEVLLAWLVLSVVLAALISRLARGVLREDADADRELLDVLGRSAAPAPSAVPSPALDATRAWCAPSPRRGPEGMAESGV